MWVKEEDPALMTGSTSNIQPEAGQASRPDGEAVLNDVGQASHNALRRG